MTNDSLIQTTGQKIADEYYSTNELHKKRLAGLIDTAMADTSARKGEANGEGRDEAVVENPTNIAGTMDTGLAAPKDSSAPIAERSCEIRYVEVSKFWEIYKDLPKNLCPEHDRPCSDTFRKAMDGAIVATREPVTVSLGKCAAIIRSASCIIGNDYCERLCESNPCACAINYSKAVLDAARVSYVD